MVEKTEGVGRVGHTTKANATSYCIFTLYASTPASGCLAASFAAEWKAVALKTIDAVAAPEPDRTTFGTARAAVGCATSTFAGGQPVWLLQIVLDAGRACRRSSS